MRIFCGRLLAFEVYECGRGLLYEIDADGRDVGFGVRVICKSEEKTGLADTTVSYKEESTESKSAT